MVAASLPSQPPPTDPRFPNLRADVVAGYLNATETQRAEVICGELSITSLPNPRHALTMGNLHVALRSPFHRACDGPGGWMFLMAAEFHLGPKPDILIPDLAGWRRERVPADFFADDAPDHIALTPDWICEILSDATEAKDRGRKRRIYSREGVRHYWIVDPRDRTLEVYRLDDGRWRELDTHAGDAVVRAEPFDAIELDLSDLWKL
jgi:Uma2 family endonuclease